MGFLVKVATTVEKDPMPAAAAISAALGVVLGIVVSKLVNKCDCGEGMIPAKGGKGGTKGGTNRTPTQPQTTPEKEVPYNGYLEEDGYNKAVADGTIYYWLRERVNDINKRIAIANANGYDITGLQKALEITNRFLSETPVPAEVTDAVEKATAAEAAKAALEKAVEVNPSKEKTDTPPVIPSWQKIKRKLYT